MSRESAIDLIKLELRFPEAATGKKEPLTLKVPPSRSILKIRHVIAQVVNQPSTSILMTVGTNILEDHATVGAYVQDAEAVISIFYGHTTEANASLLPGQAPFLGVADDIVVDPNQSTSVGDFATTNTAAVANPLEMNQKVQDISTTMNEILNNCRPALTKSMLDCFESISRDHPDMWRSRIRAEIREYLAEEEQKLLSAEPGYRLTRGGLERLVEGCQLLNQNVVDLNNNVDNMNSCIHIEVKKTVDDYWQHARNCAFLRKRIDDTVEEVVPGFCQRYLERGDQPEFNELIDRKMAAAASRYVNEDNILEKRIDARIKNAIKELKTDRIGRVRRTQQTTKELRTGTPSRTRSDTRVETQQILQQKHPLAESSSTPTGKRKATTTPAQRLLGLTNWQEPRTSHEERVLKQMCTSAFTTNRQTKSILNKSFGTSEVKREPPQ